MTGFVDASAGSRVMDEKNVRFAATTGGGRDEVTRSGSRLCARRAVVVSRSCPARAGRTSRYRRRRERRRASWRHDYGDSRRDRHVAYDDDGGQRRLSDAVDAARHLQGDGGVVRLQHCDSRGLPRRRERVGRHQLHDEGRDASGDGDGHRRVAAGRHEEVQLVGTRRSGAGPGAAAQRPQLARSRLDGAGRARQSRRHPRRRVGQRCGALPGGRLERHRSGHRRRDAELQPGDHRRGAGAHEPLRR